MFLNYLCDAAAERVKHEWRDFVYPSLETAVMETPPGDEEEEDDVVEVGGGYGVHELTVCMSVCLV